MNEDNYSAILETYKTHKVELKSLDGEDGDLDANLCVSTGIPPLDIILIGGFYLGKMYEVFGEESAGKTTLSYQVMASFQRKGGVVLLLESESSFDFERARSLGVVVEKVIRPKFDTFEEGASIIMRTIEKNKVRNLQFPILIVWDTISASATKAEKEKVLSGELSKSFSDKAILLRSFLRVVNAELSKTSSCFLVVSQVNDSISTGYGSNNPYGYEPAGGRGMRHHASSRVLVRKGSPIYDKLNIKSIIGYKTDLVLWKSKQSPEKQKITVDQYFESGFDDLNSLLDYIITVDFKIPGVEFSKNGWIKVKMKEEKSFRREDFLKYLEEVENINVLDFFVYYAYESMKKLYPISHNITRINLLQEKLSYKPTKNEE